MWITLAESVRGTSHVEANTECQDHCEISEGIHGDPGAMLFAVADGAGSAKFSAIGSRLAVAELCARIRTLPMAPELVTRETLTEIVAEIRARFNLEAKTLGCDVRDLSTTLLAGCVSEKASWFFQIGDGAIVGLKDGAYSALTWPTNGEYANSTVFVVSDDWGAQFQFVSLPGRLTEISAFTDGIQDLILVHAEKAVHAPFLRDLFSQIRAVADSKALAAPLRKFLDSKAVNERTDDDKTLVLSCWID
jgi:hypothetical protein